MALHFSKEIKLIAAKKKKILQLGLTYTIE